MRGHLRERQPGVWQLRVHAGQGSYVSKTVHGGRREAERALARLVSEVDRGKAVPSAKRTVGLLLREWYETGVADWSPATVRDHRHIIDRRIDPHLGKALLGKVSTADVDRFYATLRKQYAAGTVLRTHSVLRSAFDLGVRWGWLGVNPCVGARVPEQARRKPTVPTAAELSQIWNMLDGQPEWQLFIHLACVTGARRGQLVALTWDRVDLDAGTVTFDRTIPRAAGGQAGPRHIGKRKGASRTVALPAVTVDMLAVHRELHPKAADTGFVFARNPTGTRPWSVNTVTDKWARLCRAAGIDGVRFHDLRHWAATQMIAAGVDIRTVAGRLGHQDPSTTLNIYAAFVPASDRVAAELLAKLLDSDAI